MIIPWQRSNSGKRRVKSVFLRVMVLKKNQSTTHHKSSLEAAKLPLKYLFLMVIVLQKTPSRHKRSQPAAKPPLKWCQMCVLRVMVLHKSQSSAVKVSLKRPNSR